MIQSQTFGGGHCERVSTRDEQHWFVVQRHHLVRHVVGRITAVTQLPELVGAERVHVTVVRDDCRVRHSQRHLSHGEFVERR